MGWHAQLELDYRLADGRTLVRWQHRGPLRLLQSLYPEGAGVCHNVLVHPPGGLVGGDTLDIDVRLGAGAHGLITTPGATRFYRSAGPAACQHARVRLEDGARLEWLPLEAIAYNDCRAENRLQLALAPQAECLGWDIVALGLPQAGQPFVRGSFQQHLEVDGAWLERGRIDAQDALLMDGALGLAGQRCLASLFFVCGSPLPRERREAALELARARIAAHPLRACAGVTAPHPQVLVLRVLAPLVEPAGDLLRQVWSDWRAHFWQLPGVLPRIWST